MIIKKKAMSPGIFPLITDIACGQRQPVPSPEIGQIFEELVGLSNRSPDLAPSVFHLFRTLRDALARQEFESTEELLLAIMAVTGSIGRAGLESVFDAWQRRLNECLQMKGEHIT
jgi:hypothetical protein